VLLFLGFSNQTFGEFPEVLHKYLPVFPFGHAPMFCSVLGLFSVHSDTHQLTAVVVYVCGPLFRTTRASGLAGVVAHAHFMQSVLYFGLAPRSTKAEMVLLWL
jgi:hypothetical protein